MKFLQTDHFFVILECFNHQLFPAPRNGKLFPSLVFSNRKLAFKSWFLVLLLLEINEIKVEINERTTYRNTIKLQERE